MIEDLAIFYFLVVGALSAATMSSGDDMKISKNLTAIAWAHAVNSRQLLFDALNSNIDMIEADIILGTLTNSSNKEEIPVMGHPPAKTSDISLDTFLNEILKFNLENTKKSKGVKLDFKSTNVFNGSIDILKNLWPKMNYPIWLNADIIEGPVNQNVVLPVDPVSFFHGCKNFENAVLSIGWTTLWGSNYTDGEYTELQINQMIEAIKSNGITKTNHEITFPVRAGIAANSKMQINNLFQVLNDTNNVTLTIWSSPNDNVNVDKLRDFIFSFGLDKVYLDVPKELSNKLHLENGPNITEDLITKSYLNDPKNGVSSLFNHCSLICVGILLVSIYFRNRNI